MKINPSQIAKAMEIYKAQKPSAIRADKEKGSKKDELVLSDKAQTFQLALKAVHKNNAIDKAKIEKIRERLETGQYNVSSREIAEKIVDDLLSKKRI